MIPPDPKNELHESIRLLSDCVQHLTERHHLNAHQIDEIRSTMNEACERLERIEQSITPMVHAHQTQAQVEMAKAKIYEEQEARRLVLEGEKGKLFAQITAILQHPWALPIVVSLLLYLGAKLGIDVSTVKEMVGIEETEPVPEESVVQENAGTEMVWHVGGRR